MSDLKLRVMSGVLNFLRREFERENMDTEDKEGLEVAIQCLENIYDVKSERCRTNEPNLTEIYKFYLQNPYLNRREASADEKAEAEALKTEANLAMGKNKFIEALHLYTRAIECDPRNPVYYCNRAAAKSRVNYHTAAVRDCNIAIELDPNYSKAYGRLGLAYCGMERYTHAVECYKKAHELEPGNEGFKNNLELAKERIKDMCNSEPDLQAQPDSGNSDSSGPQQNTTDQRDDFSRTPPLSLDINMLLGNPQLMNIASQVLGGRAMQTFGYSLATEIPNIFNHLRQSFSPDTMPSNTPPENDGTSSNQESP